MKHRKQQDESDDDDTPIQPKKIIKPKSDFNDASDGSSESDHDDIHANNIHILYHTNQRLENMKQNFFDVCLENFEQNETNAIAFFCNCMKEAMEAKRDIASITQKSANVSERKSENSQDSVRSPVKGIRQNIARSFIRHRQAELNKKYGYS